MTYDAQKRCTTIDETGVFQRIEAQHPGGITIESDAHDPVDNASYVLPRATPMTPIHTADVGTHDIGIWMPVRRSLILGPNSVRTLTVVDADPFHLDDHIAHISVSGPGVGYWNMGHIAAVNYATNLITLTEPFNTNNVGIGGWIEVRENGCVNPALSPKSAYLKPYPFGLLRNPYSTVDQFSDVGGVSVGPVYATIVIDGAIKEVDVHFNDDPSDDKILMAQAMMWNSGGTIQIILPNKGEIVTVPGLSA